jgi:hypothetical protein
MWLIVAYCNKYISENYVLTPIFAEQKIALSIHLERASNAA